MGDTGRIFLMRFECSRNWLCVYGTEYKYSDRVQQPSDAHFVHHLGAMRFDCALADAEYVGDLFIDPAVYYEPTDFSLA